MHPEREQPEMRTEDILAACIDEVRRGRSTIEDCIGRHPELRDELQSLLETAASVSAPVVALRPEFRLRSRERLMEVMGFNQTITDPMMDRFYEPQSMIVIPASMRPSAC